MSTHTLNVPDGHLAYAREGSGPPIVLLHGGALDHHLWDPQVPALAPRFTVVRPDLRGHGRSSTPTTPFRHCDDVAALIRQIDLGPAIVVGLSLGAGTATDLALEHPGLVGRLVLSGAGGDSAPQFRDPWLVATVAEWNRAAEAADAEAWVDVFLRIGAGPHRTPADLDPAVVDYLRRTAMQTVIDHVRPDAVAPTALPGAIDRLAEIDVPVRSIDGELDAADHLRLPREVTTAVTDGASTTVPDSAHYPNLERPDHFNETLLAFGLSTAPE
ncbi:alpha/beta fold hydrolase [Patulibacter minatonensis]|uniref:alpha/beta fold hydrolase n=1 Tax=Patulibacter minatonensis TaxID=298163 RepID=UPI00047AF5F0|nr:alpha/beta hydrolase [Patulibacter minatonensis]